MQKIKNKIETTRLGESENSSLLDGIIEATNTFTTDDGWYRISMKVSGKEIVKNIRIEKQSNTGIIVDDIEGNFLIESNGRKKLAKKAVSCLVFPQIGDKVSLFIDDEEIYIINILSSKKSLTIKTEELTMEIDKINLKSKVFDINVQNIISKISKLNAFVKNIDLSSLFTKFQSTDIEVTAQTKKEFVQFRINNYETLDTKINSIEKKEANIVKKNINIEHKNVGSMFTKATGQIKLDAENINFG